MLGMAPPLLSIHYPRGTETNLRMQQLLADILLDSELSYGPMQPREGKGFCPLAFSPLDSMATTTVQNQLDREVGVCSDGTDAWEIF